MSATSVVPARPLGAGAILVASATMAFIVIGSLAGIAVVSEIGTSRLDAAGAVSFAMILGILWAAMFLEILSRPYSIHLVNLFAMYVLLGISPLYHVMIGQYPIAFFSQVDPAYVLSANTAIVLWLLGYLVAYAASSAAARRSLARQSERWLLRSIPPGRVGLEMFIAIGVLAYLTAIGLSGAVTRGATHYTLEGTSSHVYVINKVLARYYPVVATAAGLLLLRRVSTLRIPATAALVLLVGGATTWIANPMGAGRYWVATVVLALFAPHFLHKQRTGALILLALTAGLTVVPGLGAFEVREAQTIEELAEGFSGVTSPIQYLALNADLAEYGFLVLTLRWMEVHGHTWGLQILGAILVWVPRLFWPGKPVATGTLVTGEMGYDFTNLSAPIVAEPLIDFGYLAVPFFAAIFGWIFARLDTVYWFRQEGDERRLRVIDTFYPFIMGLQLFLVRGGLNYALMAIASVFLSALPMTAALRARRAPQTEQATAVGPPAKPIAG